jgi:hypothetical protein
MDKTRINHKLNWHVTMNHSIENWRKISHSGRYPERVVERGPHEVFYLYNIMIDVGILIILYMYSI